MRWNRPYGLCICSELRKGKQYQTLEDMKKLVDVIYFAGQAYSVLFSHLDRTEDIVEVLHCSCHVRIIKKVLISEKKGVILCIDMG